MGKVVFLCKIILIILLLIIGIFLLISISKCIYSNFDKFVISFFRNMTLSDKEHQAIDEKIKEQYKKSSLYKVVNCKEVLKNQNDKITEESERLDLLSSVQDFYKEEVKIFSNDYSEFLKKIEFMFKMFSLPIPVYAGAISYILEKRTNSEFEYSVLLLAIIIYVYYFVRVVWIQSLKNGFSKLPVEYPFLIKKYNLEKIY